MLVGCGGISLFSPNKETLICPRRCVAGPSVSLPPEIGPKGTHNALRCPRTPLCVSLFGELRKKYQCTRITTDPERGAVSPGASAPLDQPIVAARYWPQIPLNLHGEQYPHELADRDADAVAEVVHMQTHASCVL